MKERTVGKFGEPSDDAEFKSISISEDGQVILSAGIDGRVMAW